RRRKRRPRRRPRRRRRTDPTPGACCGGGVYREWAPGIPGVIVWRAENTGQGPAVSASRRPRPGGCGLRSDSRIALTPRRVPRIERRDTVCSAQFGVHLVDTARGLTVECQARAAGRRLVIRVEG